MYMCVLEVGVKLCVHCMHSSDHAHLTEDTGLCLQLLLCYLLIYIQPADLNVEKLSFFHSALIWRKLRMQLQVAKKKKKDKN